MLSKGDIIFCEWNGILQIRIIERVEGNRAYAGYQKFRRTPLASGQILQLGGLGAADIRYWKATNTLKVEFERQNRFGAMGTASVGEPEVHRAA